MKIKKKKALKLFIINVFDLIKTIDFKKGKELQCRKPNLLEN